MICLHDMYSYAQSLWAEGISTYQANHECMPMLQLAIICITLSSGKPKAVQARKHDVAKYDDYTLIPCMYNQILAIKPI